MDQGSEVFFLLMGAILVFAMHGGFAFLEAGTVRHKNQVNALVKILEQIPIIRNHIQRLRSSCGNRLRRVGARPVRLPTRGLPSFGLPPFSATP